VDRQLNLKLRRWSMRVLVGLLLLAAVGYALRDVVLGVPVETVAAIRGDLVQSVVATGRIATPQRVSVGSVIMGRVARIPVSEGQSVKRGDILIELDGDEERAAVEQARSALAQAEAKLRQLREFGLPSAQQSQLQAQAKYTQARRHYERSLELKAKGFISQATLDDAQREQAGKELMVLAPAGETQIVVQIDEKNFAQLSIGQPALASADAYSRSRFDAVLVYINPGIDALRGSVEVKLLVPNPPDYLRQDMTVSVDIEVARSRGTVVVPADAIHDADGAQPWVLAIHDALAERRLVRLGLKGEGRVEILEGVRPGDRLIPNGQAAIRAGQRVREARGMGV
jgi:HlyD family secretion protein